MSEYQIGKDVQELKNRLEEIEKILKAPNQPTRKKIVVYLSNAHRGGKRYTTDKEINDGNDVYLKAGSAYEILLDGSIQWEGQTKTEDADSTTRTKMRFMNKNDAIIGPVISHTGPEMTIEGYWYAYTPSSGANSEVGNIYNNLGDKGVIEIESA